jgi:hypothetical protein
VNRIVKAAFWAIPPILLLVVLPRVLVGYVPASFIRDANSVVGLNVPTVVADLTVFGIVLAALSALQTWAYDWSMVKPVASSLHMSTTYVLLLFLLGYGDPLTFGTANIPLSFTSLGVPSGNVTVNSALPFASLGALSKFGTVNIALISTFLALLAGIALSLKVVQRGLKYVEAKRFHEQEVVSVAPASPVSPVPRFCQKCGTELEEGHKFCSNCGSPIETSAPPPDKA